MRSARGSEDRGSVAAEFAIALPALAVVLAVCVWGVQLAGVQVRLEDAAGLAARAAARGDSADAAVAAVLPGAAVRLDVAAALVCVDVSATVAAPGGLVPMALSARSCALPVSW